jgi:hypothetical protein
MTHEDLDKHDRCKHLLESPAPLVVGKLINEIRRYMKFVDEVKQIKRGNIDEDVIDEILRRHEM